MTGDAGARLPAPAGYDRSATSIGIVHLGPGAFFRAHQAGYIDDLLARDPRWAICAAALRSAGVRDALAPQEGLYTLVELGAEIRMRTIGAVREWLAASEDADRLAARLASPEVRLVTLTVTEKGYCLGPDGGLDLEHPDIRQDLATPEQPASAPGWICEGLFRRWRTGAAPFVTLSCDNLPANGERLRGAVLSLADRRSSAFRDWVAAEALFPCSMVDSITPATDDALRDLVAGRLGIRDAWPVQREQFTQWVIEESVRACGADLESVGAILTRDVAAWEQAKLRLLNGAHSTLAYVGLLRGRRTVREAMEDAALAGFVDRLMRQDIAATLKALAGLDLPAYVDALQARFANPAIAHQLSQIAWDGSQKLPIRILGTVRDALAAGRPVGRLAVPVAAWIAFVRREAAAGREITDPHAEALLALGRSTDLAALLGFRPVFPADLAGDPRFAGPVLAVLEALATPHDTGYLGVREAPDHVPQDLSRDPSGHDADRGHAGSA